jgi:hypothetical protein
VILCFFIAVWQFVHTTNIRNFCGFGAGYVYYLETSLSLIDGKNQWLTFCHILSIGTLIDIWYQ